MTCGAAYGAGIYLSPHSNTSSGYAASSSSWPKSRFGNEQVQCMAICEVINNGYTANPHYVIQNEDHVLTRFFCVYKSGQIPSLDSTTKEFKQKLEQVYVKN